MARINGALPDYELEDRIVVTGPAQLRAMSDPLRGTILDLLLERAATVTELAAALGRPKSTVAHHVKVLLDAGLLKVVRTRRVRAIEERFYGRTARLFAMGWIAPEHRSPPPWTSYLADAAAESEQAYLDDTMWANIRHARISRDRAREFWRRAEALVREFSELPREGETVFGFIAALYPTDHPALPEPTDAEAAAPGSGAAASRRSAGQQDS
jgi:DNA-binding transcriptional ArsR family regulator